MKFTFKWLKEFVDYTGTPEDLATLLTMSGLEVESLAPVREPETNSRDWLFEIAVTPNRGDCLGIAGIAREVAALTGAAVKTVRMDFAAGALDRQVSVAIEDSGLCARYSALVLRGPRAAASPAWMRFRLESCGIRSINNIVDVTNYVMLETGQPLHAFDLDRLPARQIVVRPAGSIRKFVTLDGVERELVEQDLLICDGAVPIALAGIMGGANSEVRETTRTLLLESASFDAVTIRRSAKRLALRSEASHRFERGVDPEGTVAALKRSACLFQQLTSTAVDGDLIDCYPRPPARSSVRVRTARVEHLLGVPLDAQRAGALLRSLGLDAGAHGDAVEVVQSSRRPDLTREADFIEEVARLYGYEHIPSTLPLARLEGAGRDERLASERRLRSFLAGEGLAEVINLPFVNEDLNRGFPGLWDGAPAPVAVLNPLTNETAEMRLSLIPGLLENLRLNLTQRATSFHAYHLGKVFRSGGGGSEERTCLGAVVYGPRPRLGLRLAEQTPAGFFECKGVIEGIFELFAIGAVEWDRASRDALHPGRSAVIALREQTLGYMGEIHPDRADALALPRCCVFELDFDRLLQYAPRQVTARALPRFPSIERDLALVVDSAFPSQQIIRWINGLGEALIESVEVFDQYLGPPIPDGKKSLAYKISYRAGDRTLTDAEVQIVHQRLVERLAQVFGAQLRT